MAYVKVPGDFRMAWWGRIAQSLSISAALLIDATGEKAAFQGPVQWNDNSTSKDITKVGIRFGTVTKAGGSALTLSLQNVSTAAGTPMQPDETQDQTVAIANANAAFASNAYLHSAALSANRTVSRDELLAVVLEYDGAGRLGSDSVVLSGHASVDTGGYARAMAVLKTGGTWAQQSVLSNVILEFTDGSFGTLGGGMPFSAVNNHAYKSDSSPDEYALKFQLPFAGKIGGVDLWNYMAAVTSDFSVVLYDSDGTTALATTTVSGYHGFASFREMFVPFSTEIAFAANTNYWISVKPTQATSLVYIAYTDVSAVGHMDAYIGGQNWLMNSRTDAGAWSNVTTRKPWIAPRVSSIDTGGGSVGNLSGGIAQ
jgi:hypothetical protein